MLGTIIYNISSLPRCPMIREVAVNGEQDVEWWERRVGFWLYGVLALVTISFGVPANLTSVYVFIRSQATLHQSTYRYMLYLALCDSFILLLQIPFCAQNLLEDSGPIIRKLDWKVFTKASPFLYAIVNGNHVLASWFTALLSLDRVLRIIYYPRKPRVCTRRVANIVSIYLVVIAIGYGFARSFELGTMECIDRNGAGEFIPADKKDVIYLMAGAADKVDRDEFKKFYSKIVMKENKTIKILNSASCRSTQLTQTELSANVIYAYSMVTIHLVLQFFIPGLIILISSAVLVTVVYRTKKVAIQMLKHEGSVSAPPVLDTTRQQSFRKGMILPIVVFAMFLLLQLPALCSRILELLGVASRTLIPIGNYLLLLSSAMNLVLFFFSGRQFRRLFYEIFSCGRKTNDNLIKLRRVNCWARKDHATLNNCNVQPENISLTAHAHAYEEPGHHNFTPNNNTLSEKSIIVVEV